LVELADEERVLGEAGSRTKIRESRQLYADDVLSALLTNAGGGTEDSYSRSVAATGEAVAAFWRFANAALDAYFFQHRDALTRLPDSP
jgi:hypothetical protein